MTNAGMTLEAATAIGYIGQVALIELVWEGDPEPIWRLKHIVGVVLPIQGVNDVGYFLTKPCSGVTEFPDETYFHSIRTIRVMQHRDRQPSGKLLGSVPLPHLMQGQAESGEGSYSHV